MADIRTEIQSIRDFVATELPGATFQLQNMSETYKAGVMAIEFAQGSSTSETAYHYRNDHLYQLVYFGTSKLDCATKMQAVGRKFNDKQVVELGDTGRYLRVASFSVSKAFKTETSGVYAIIGMLDAKMRESRNKPTVPKITEITTTMNTTINLRGGR